MSLAQRRARASAAESWVVGYFDVRAWLQPCRKGRLVHAALAAEVRSVITPILACVRRTSAAKAEVSHASGGMAEAMP